MITRLLIFAAYTLSAWAIHAGLVAFYMKMFESTKSIGFRATHALEIGMTVLAAMLIYLSFTQKPLSLQIALVTILLLLALVDLIAFRALSINSAKSFDAIHFITAYAVVLTAVCIAYAIRKS